VSTEKFLHLNRVVSTTLVTNIELDLVTVRSVAVSLFNGLYGQLKDL